MDIINLGGRIVNNWAYPIQNGYVLVDTGYETGWTGCQKALSANGLAAKDIRYVFLTHAHDDHAGFLNALLAENPEIQVVLSEKALKGLRRGQNAFVGGCTTRLALLFCKVMGLLGKGAHRFPPLREEFEKNLLFATEKKRDELEKALEGRIIETPGHTECSISLLHHCGVLFLGDAAMNGLPSLHKITIFAENKAEFCATWGKILKLQVKRIYPGHGKPFLPTELAKNLPYAEKMKLYPLLET